MKIVYELIGFGNLSDNKGHTPKPISKGTHQYSRTGYVA